MTPAEIRAIAEMVERMILARERYANGVVRGGAYHMIVEQTIADMEKLK